MADESPVQRMNGTVLTNGKQIAVDGLPLSVEAFLMARDLLPRSVVVEHNGEAVAPSDFAERMVESGDRLEIVRIVAGG